MDKNQPAQLNFIFRVYVCDEFMYTCVQIYTGTGMYAYVHVCEHIWGSPTLMLGIYLSWLLFHFTHLGKVCQSKAELVWLVLLAYLLQGTICFCLWRLELPSRSQAIRSHLLSFRCFYLFWDYSCFLGCPQIYYSQRWSWVPNHAPLHISSSGLQVYTTILGLWIWNPGFYACQASTLPS